MKNPLIWGTLVCLLMSFSAVRLKAHSKTTPESPVHITDDGRISYHPYPNGDRVPDYSFAGYKLSQTPIPFVPVKVVVPVMEGDATGVIQSALDYVGSLPPDAAGIRGAVLLEKGTYRIKGTLYLRSSGVVLRGSGYDEEGTVLLAGGTDKSVLIRMMGINNRKTEEKISLKDKYYPVNTTVLEFDAPHPYKPGDHLIVHRPSTAEWLADIGADRIGNQMEYNLVAWKPGDFDIDWERTVKETTATTVTLDIPLTQSLDPKYGEGYTARFEWNGRISDAGVENLRCISEYDPNNPKDEDHRWMAVTIENAQDVWVCRMAACHFASSAVAVWETAKRVTVEDCLSLVPVSEEANHRRFSFQTLGQQVLFQRCYSEFGYHDFVVGFTVPGPTAFVQCQSYRPLHFSGTLGGWSTGVLFDKMTSTGGSLDFSYRDMDSQGAGWTTANSLFYQCRAGQMHNQKPPGAQNWNLGMWTQPYGDGHYEVSHTYLKPESFFYGQLEARLGHPSSEAAKIYEYETDETTAPTPEYARRMSLLFQEPDMTIDRWIDILAERYPIDTDADGAEIFTRDDYAAVKSKEKAPELTIKNGWIVRGDRIVAGATQRTSMWRGTTKPSDLNRPTPNLNRFVPGRIGRGLTDDLDTLAQDMIDKNVAMIAHFPALWYERRRDDHERAMRANADVWAPFLEQPFSRTGIGEAYDRMSKYDLAKFNPFYWSRLRRFADLADEMGLVLWHEHYLQHNIIEEGGHWVDYPWRAANNINGDTGFVEPTRYAGDKRVYMAEAFYDLSNDPLVVHHRRYIRKSVDNFDGNNGLIHSIASEYTGSGDFMGFWLEQIREWADETGNSPLVSVNGTKDVLDRMLTEKGNLFNVIDISKWHYKADGELYAPLGGVSLAWRQYTRLWDPGEVSFSSVYRAVSEYKLKYPEKAVVYSNQLNIPNSGWAVFMAGGSLARIPYVDDDRFLVDASEMEIMESGINEYVLGEPGVGYIIYSERSEIGFRPENDPNRYIGHLLDPRSGAITNLGEFNGDNNLPAGEGPLIVWLRRE